MRKDIEYEEKTSAIPPDQSRRADLFEDIAKWRKDKHVKTKRTRVLEKLDELRASLMVVKE